LVPYLIIILTTAPINLKELLMKKIMISLTTGILLGSAVTFFILKHDPIDEKQIKTTQISGEKITHSNWSTKGNIIKFRTASEGKGEIETEIPKHLIPEANAWINNIHSIGPTASINYHQREFYPLIGLEYQRRWKSISASLGAAGWKNAAQFSGSIKYIFPWK